MIKQHQRGMQWMLFWLLLFSLAACSPSKAPATTPPPIATSTSTPTPITNVEITPPSTNPCANISGAVEMQVLVGPAEVVGLEPVAIGSIPFRATSESAPYAIQGSGTLNYQDVLEEAWGSYTVTFDMDATLSGECIPNGSEGTLNITMIASGEQMVEVRAEGFSGDYPWEGTYELPMSFPLTEGATVEGEGRIFVLHLNQ